MSAKPRKRPAAEPPPTPRIASWLPVLALVVIGVIAYANSFNGALVGDDDTGITQNTTIRSLSDLGTVLRPPADTTVAARPIANLTFAINYAIAGGTSRLGGYHAVNLLIHVLTALVLFDLIRRTLRSPALRDRFTESGAQLTSFAIVAIWIAHPLNTQAVTFLVQRVESLMGLFFVSTIYCAVRAAESAFRSRGWIAGAIVACALGMGTKETMIGAPLVAAAWIWVCWPGEKLTGRPRALLIGLGATMVIAIGLAMSGARSGSAGFGAGGWTSIGYLRTQAGVIVHYIRLAFWPDPLVFQYSWLPAESWRAVMPQAILLLTFAAATLAALARRWPIALAGLWFFVILAPSSSIIPISTEVAAEHRMYLPLVAVIAVAVLGLRYLARLAGSVGAPFINRAGTAALILVVVMLALTTIDRNRAYASAETMAADTVRNRPQSANAQLIYGTVLVDQKRFAEAETHLREAASLPIPASTDASKMRSLAHFYLGLALVAQQKHDQGSQELEKVLAMRADFDRAYRPLAEAQLSLRRTPDAVRTLERAIARQPDDPVLRRRIAWVLATSSNDAARNGRRAIEHAERAVALTESRDPLAFDVLAAAHAEAGQFDNALTALASAVNIIRASGQTEVIGMLRSHLALFEAKRPIRSADW